MTAKAPKKQPVFQPWVPPLSTSAFEVGSLQALADGKATERQQKCALAFIIKILCETDEVSFAPGEDGDRVTSFAEGKRWVGLMIRTYLSADVGKFENQKERPN